MPNEISPCPFCGTAPQFASVTDLTDNFDHGFTIWCGECGIDFHDEYRDDVLKRWNTRSLSNTSPSDAERHERAIPDAWQWRMKPAEGSPWSEWREGRANFGPDVGFVWEERSLYAAPPAAVQEPAAVKDVETIIWRGWLPDDSQPTVLSTSQSDPPPEMASRRVKLTKEGAKDAALDFVRKIGWKPGNSISLHSSVELMAAFGLMIDAGEVQCDWPNCGCCTDAACRDAVTFMDFEAEIAALRAENELLREALPEELTGKLQWAMHDAFMNSKADTVAGQMIDIYDVVRAAYRKAQGVGK